MIASLKRENGVLHIDIDGTLYEPLSFKSFRPTERNISDFYKAGVRLFSILSSGLNSMLGVPYSLYGENWLDYETYDFSPVDKQIELFLDNAPEGYFALMIQLDTRPWYCEKEDVPSSFWKLSQIAADLKWRFYAAKYLRAILSHVEERFGDKFYGYFLLCGTTTEWFSERDYLESHPIKEKAFQEYLHDSAAVIPSKERRDRPSCEAFYDPTEDRDVIAYERFHNTLITDTMLYFAVEAQKVIKHKKLIGVYYGYLFELDGARLFNTGGMDYERIFLSPDIDMISSPSSYAYRNHDSTSAFMVTYDTLNQHNKLYYLEFDHITHLAPQYVEGIGIPGYTSKFADEQQTIDVMRRDFMLCLSKGAALWWFDMFEGWFYSDGMMTEVARMVQIARDVHKTPLRSSAEIAVFAEGACLSYVNKESHINTAYLSKMRGGLARMGAPYDVYSMCDLPDVDFSHYKLVIFLDAFQWNDMQRGVLRERIQREGRTVLFLGMPDYVGTDALCTDAVSAITGIYLTPVIGEQRIRTSLSGITETFGNPLPITPLFAAEDDDAIVLGEYEISGKPALVQKKIRDYTSVFCGTGSIPYTVLRYIARMSGVHIYCEFSDAVYVNDRLIGVYFDTDGETVLHLPRYGALCDLFTEKIYHTDPNGNLAFCARKGMTLLLQWCDAD